jgi:hypothetical protein
MINTKYKDKIIELQLEIASLYEQYKLSRTEGAVCDICGTGHVLNKSGYVQPAKNVIRGYEHRENKSPKLCKYHYTCWGSAYLRNTTHTSTDLEIDLVFAEFLAKRLVKETQRWAREVK